METALFAAICLLPALIIALAMTEVVRRGALRAGFVDRPAARKVHAAPTALGGGVAIWLAVAGPLLGALLVSWLIHGGLVPASWLPEFLRPHVPGILGKAPQLLAVLGAGTLLAGVGLYDDVRAVGWFPRLVVQFVAAGIVVAAGIHLTLFVALPWFGKIVTLFWVVLLVNAFNFLDNMNGLSAGIAMIAAGVLAVIMLTALPDPHWFVAGTMLILAGALAGFLAHNWRGRIFMGDAGSYFVGLLIAAVTTAATFYESRLGSRHVLLAPICVLAVPLYDFTSVMIIRLAQGRSPFHPDKSHFSHRLVELGMTPSRAVLTIYLATLTTGLAALALYHVAGWPGAWILITMVFCVLLIVAILETTGRRAARAATARDDATLERSREPHALDSE